MDSETFLLMGFMVLLLLFAMFDLMQRMQGRRRELPPSPVRLSHPARTSLPACTFVHVSRAKYKGACDSSPVRMTVVS